MDSLFKKETRSCRCEFVHQWLDAHEKYFAPAPRNTKLISRVSKYSFGPSPVHFFYSTPLPAPLPPRNIQLPYIVRAPHRISPLRPIYH